MKKTRKTKPFTDNYVARWLIFTHESLPTLLRFCTTSFPVFFTFSFYQFPCTNAELLLRPLDGLKPMADEVVFYAPN